MAGKLLLSLLVISVLVFALTAAIPGDPARAVLGKAATPGQLAAFRAAHGLNEHLYLQYLHFVVHLLEGKLGTSFASGQPVTTVIGARLARTFWLVLFAWLIAAAVAVPGGIWAGRRAGGLADSASSAVVLTVAALPEFVIGLLLVFLVAVRLRLLPVNSTTAGFSDTPIGDLSAYVLPAVTIALTNGEACVSVNTLKIFWKLVSRVASVLGPDDVITALTPGTPCRLGIMRPEKQPCRISVNLGACTFGGVPAYRSSSTRARSGP